jgi:hypothetical protein
LLLLGVEVELSLREIDTLRRLSRLVDRGDGGERLVDRGGGGERAGLGVVSDKMTDRELGEDGEREGGWKRSNSGISTVPITGDRMPPKRDSRS